MIRRTVAYIAVVKRILGFTRMALDRMCLLPVKLGESWLFMADVQRKNVRMLEKIAEVSKYDNTNGRRYMMVRPKKQSGIDSLIFPLGDKSAIDTLRELENDEYGLQELNLEGGFVLDIGANVGDFSVLCAKKGAEVWAFEPSEIAFGVIAANCYLNSVEALVTAHSFGVLNETGTFPAIVDRFGTGAGKIWNSKGSYFYENTTFNVVDIAEVISKVPRKIDFMKIDIEGSEYKVLERIAECGGFSDIQKGAIEYHQGKVEEIRDLLCEEGYSVAIRPKNKSVGIVKFSR